MCNGKLDELQPSYSGSRLYTEDLISLKSYLVIYYYLVIVIYGYLVIVIFSYLLLFSCRFNLCSYIQVSPLLLILVGSKNVSATECPVM